MYNIKRNVVYNFLQQFLVIFLPFVTAPYLSRVTGPAGIGLYSYSYSVALYFTYFTMLGLNNYGNREIASTQTDKESRSKTFWEIYTLQVICFGICLFVYMIYAIEFAQDKRAALIQGVFVLSSLLDINWFFFGIEQFKITVVRNIIVKLTTVVLIFIFVKDSNDIYIYIGIMACGFFVSQISLWPYLKRYIHFVRVSFKDVLKHVKPNLILFIPVLSVSIYKIMDKIMIGYMSTITELGYFDNAEKIINVPLALIAAIGTAMMPRITALIANNKISESRKYLDKTMLIVLAFATGAMVGIIGVSEDFSILYYGDAFKSSGVIMNYLAITILLIACGNVIRSQYLIPSRKDSVFIVSTVLGAVLNFILNLVLIPMFGAVGAAVSTIFAELLVCFYQLFSVRKEFSFSLYLKWELYFLFSGLLMYLVIRYIPTGSNEQISLISQVLFGSVIYTLMAGWFIVKQLKIDIKKH
ncbi:O-antigen/teichoic acid export membrane protein [Paenibacillus cellulosilyticus]|uniref:O-antigen/teichoic acid export membrane protein n=1 Tax=Paenibacillus cellulosilyticus TaxID=375489 RepID=A0A2V2Z084_9BACL|nr:flippase [Paenibacillus cellulosilyticus]PWW08474.1 O-antigen/teichoic acid export membrane protein [Paenibacillus cellulosilyticus]QKS48059.1 flippase [Paenibacillus cellulosilyticus]